jgi:hypothetical protein
MSKGGVRQATVDGLPRAIQWLRRWCWCCVAGMVSGAQAAFRTYIRRVSKYGPPVAARWLPGVSGALKFRDGRSRDRICWPSMCHRLGVCGVGRYDPVGAQCVVHRWRPYRVECTGSLPTSEVKRRRARLVLGWGTAREDLRVLPAFRSCVRGLLWLFCPSRCWYNFPHFDSRSAVAQWLACWAHNPKVRGSKPRCAISRLSVLVGFVRCCSCFGGSSSRCWRRLWG